MKEFNEKYNLNIQDINANEINLIGKFIGNEGLKDLTNIEFKELEELYLNMNDISEIKELEKAKFEKLQILTLSGNEISDISILEKVNFKELKFLYLLNNKNISDITVLDKVKFEKLERLNLAENNISDISILESVNFKNWKELYLSWNKISNIKVLGITFSVNVPNEFNIEYIKLDKLSLSWFIYWVKVSISLLTLCSKTNLLINEIISDAK